MNHSVLIVDDSLTVRMDLVDAFQSAGFRPIPCGSVAEAREALRREPVDVVVLDVLLPDGNGVDLLKELRANETFSATPILMLSTEGEVKDRVRGLKTGANEYVGKPYETAYVVARARELVPARRPSSTEVTRVLVIDDSPTYLEELRVALENEGYEVVGAATGEAGLAAAAELRPDAMIVDRVLPGIDGATVIRRVRLDAPLRGVPCIMLTGSEAHDTELGALDAGADDFVRKDQDIAVILAKLSAALRRSSAAAPVPEFASFLGPKGPKKVLVVDDSPHLLEALATSLRGEGYDVVGAGSGEEALDLLALQRVDCILLDLIMPGMGGEATCKCIKAAPGLKDIPLVMLTVLEDRDAMIRGLGSGADDYIAKSSDLEVLKARVRAQIRRKQFEDENRQIREALLAKELEAVEARAAWELASTRAALVAELERKNKELVETTVFLNNVLESSTGYSIVAEDLDGKILAWNEGARRNYGYTAHEMVGKQNSSILHVPEDVESGRAKALRDTVLTMGKAEGVFERVRRNGQRFTATVVVTVLRDSSGSAIGYVMISKDITEQKRLEEQLRRNNEELAEQNRQVQQANRLKSEFLANMSHELRTPLNGIIGFSELMRDGKMGPVSAEHEECLRDISTSARHLLRLISEVLDMASVESGKMELHPETVDLRKLVGEVCKMFRTLSAPRRIRVCAEVDVDVPAVLDRAKLKQVLYNYLSNALKFTGDGGNVTVRVKAAGTDHFHLSVEDDGMGIPPEDLGRLFVEFQQLDSSAAKKYPGTGLGLALTRRIVEAQGGYVGVHSTPGKGSVFFAVLPIVHLQATDDDPASPFELSDHTGAPASPRILVVEDDEPERTRLAVTLAEAGYTVSVAEDGTTAVGLCKKQRFDALTLDLLLPDMTGWDVLRILRARGVNRNVPVIVATAVPDKKLTTSLAVQNFLVKPVDADDLLNCLRRANLQPGVDRLVLVVDDDANDLKLIVPALQENGYRVICRRDGQSALHAAANLSPQAVVLDLLLPDMEGLEFVQQLRGLEIGPSLPVIVWTVKELEVSEREVLLRSVQAIVPKAGLTSTLLDEVALNAPLASDVKGAGRVGSLSSTAHPRD